VAEWRVDTEAEEESKVEDLVVGRKVAEMNENIEKVEKCVLQVELEEEGLVEVKAGQWLKCRQCLKCRRGRRRQKIGVKRGWG